MHKIFDSNTLREILCCTPDRVNDRKVEKFACGEASININNMAELKNMGWTEHVEMLAIFWGKKHTERKSMPKGRW